MDGGRLRREEGRGRKREVTEVVIEIGGGVEAEIEGAEAVARAGTDTEGEGVVQDQEVMEGTGDTVGAGAGTEGEI